MLKKIICIIIMLICLMFSISAYALSPKDEELIRTAFMNGFIQAVETLSQDDIKKFKDPQYKCMYKDKVETEAAQYITIIKSMNPDKGSNNAAE